MMIRKLHYLLTLFFISNISNAQQVELMNTNWYVYKVTLGTVDYLAPMNKERALWNTSGTPEFKYNGATNEFQSAFCAERTHQNVTFIGNNMFQITNQIDLSGNGCKETENINFNDRFFVGMDFPLGQPVSYTITSVNKNDLELVIELHNSDKVYFYNTMLAVKSTVFQKVVLFPNPIENELNLDLSSVPENNYSLKIFDALGRLVKKQEVVSGGLITLNTAELTSGYYFVHIVNKNGTSELTEKIIKK